MQKSNIGLIAVAALLACPVAAQTTASKLQANFKAADKNSDKKLSKAEFRKFIDANADDKLGRAGMVRQFGAYDRAFLAVDANGDGYVSTAELAAMKK